jgi:hypothetical protein
VHESGPETPAASRYGPGGIRQHPGNGTQDLEAGKSGARAGPEGERGGGEVVVCSDEKGQLRPGCGTESEVSSGPRAGRRGNGLTFSGRGRSFSLFPISFTIRSSSSLRGALASHSSRLIVVLPNVGPVDLGVDVPELEPIADATDPRLGRRNWNPAGVLERDMASTGSLDRSNTSGCV